MNISDYGWNEFFGKQLDELQEEHLYAGRVLADYGQYLKVITNDGEIKVKRNNTMHIAVGDWLVLKACDDSKEIYSVLDRTTKFSRSAAGTELKEQIVAANVDTVFIIQSLNNDFNMKRLQRYMLSAWESGALPVIVLTKADCCEDIGDKLVEVYNTAPGVEVHAISCLNGYGLDEINKYLLPHKTIALLGSSGVGKSTLVNTLMGKELLKTQEIREEDSKGRHTTTHREIVLLPNKCLIMDTPGMRSLSLWNVEHGIDMMFNDIEKLISECRFNNCTHGNEPGCAVKKALRAGVLSDERWKNYLKLQRELKYLNRAQKLKEKMALKKTTKSSKHRKNSRNNKRYEY
ncbi:ribosome small subunit-dependent GTPase A [Clostridiaceae bacterium M8S5]|nr:ribosome small subunit-dependent GTPase A [Clostridiaceae bacterium M8S5]